MKKIITSRSYIHGSNYVYIENSGMLDVLNLLGIITNVSIRHDKSINGKWRYYVELQSEVTDADQH